MKDVSKCAFENGIVPYMYGELPAREATEFESHLLDCVECTDEFAAVSAARFEVYEWKKLEFEPLATPVIQLPAMEAAGVSWFDKLRAAFANGWAIPTVAFAGLAVATAFTLLFVLSGDTDKQIVANTNEPIPSSSVAETKPPTVATPVNAPPEPERAVVTEPRVVRSTATKQTQPRRTPRVDRPVTPKVDSLPTTAQQPPKAPRLNGFDEEEDTSLRLAELFENIDTRE